MEKKVILITKKVDTEFFKGSIQVSALSYPERIEYSKKSTLTAVENPDTKQMQIELNNSLDRAQEYYELANARATEINIKMIEGDVLTDINSIDELMLYREGQEIVMDIATSLIAGIQLGKPKLNALSETV